MTQFSDTMGYMYLYAGSIWVIYRLYMVYMWVLWVIIWVIYRLKHHNLLGVDGTLGAIG